jgi:hypothetical protein
MPLERQKESIRGDGLRPGGHRPTKDLAVIPDQNYRVQPFSRLRHRLISGKGAQPNGLRYGRLAAGGCTRKRIITGSSRSHMLTMTYPLSARK